MTRLEKWAAIAAIATLFVGMVSAYLAYLAIPTPPILKPPGPGPVRNTDPLSPGPVRNPKTPFQNPRGYDSVLSAGGFETGSKAGDKLKDLKEKAGQFEQKAGDKLKELKDKAGPELKDLKDKAGEKLKELGDKAKDIINKETGKN